MGSPELPLPSCGSMRRRGPAARGADDPGPAGEPQIRGVPRPDIELGQGATATFRERGSMILGMNPRKLREQRTWSVYLWQMRHHWALVLRPGGEAFTARIVDDFVRNAHHCFNAEVGSANFFLVYELLVEAGDLFLMISVKCDFDPDYDLVQWLGEVGPLSFEDIELHALAVVGHYRNYCLVGCNCQHFATDLARSLGAPLSLTPEDEAVVCAASDSAAALGTMGISIATAAATGALAVAALAPAAPTAVVFGSVSYVLCSVAMVAGTLGVIGGVTLVGVTCSYRTLHAALRDTGDQGSDGADGGDDGCDDKARATRRPSSVSFLGSMYPESLLQS
mmetsp:Transcript_46500/g.131472  ORF Transcript_46500/g.131472 Transcript_46500/m.131472 type:complete len:337 (-) Transcript_46500:256-1266(-)